jgi:hypothetical protein
MDLPPVDTRLAHLLQKLDQSCATHPNVSIVWRTYFYQKMRRLEADIDKCQHLLDNVLPEMQDIPLTTLLLLGHIPLMGNTGEIGNE